MIYDDADIDMMIDKQKLADLVYNYCRGVDRRDFVLLRSLYHDDAIDDHGHMFCGSADEYIAWLPGNLAPFESTVHSVSNMLFVVDGDRANGELYANAYHRTAARPSEEIIIGGRYLDQYERREGVWKFFRRSLVMDWCRVLPTDPSIYDQTGLGAPLGQPDGTDPSYEKLALLARSRAVS